MEAGGRRRGGGGEGERGRGGGEEGIRPAQPLSSRQSCNTHSGSSSGIKNLRQ